MLLCVASNVLIAYHIGRLFADFTTSNSHCDADVRFFERWAVVHAIAGDAHDGTDSLVALHDDEFLLRRRACEHELLVGTQHVVELRWRHVLQLAAVNHCRHYLHSKQESAAFQNATTSITSSYLLFTFHVDHVFLLCV